MGCDGRYRSPGGHAEAEDLCGIMNQAPMSLELIDVGQVDLLLENDKVVEFHQTDRDRNHSEIALEGGVLSEFRRKSGHGRRKWSDRNPIGETCFCGFQLRDPIVRPAPLVGKSTWVFLSPDNGLVLHEPQPFGHRRSADQVHMRVGACRDCGLRHELVTFSRGCYQGIRLPDHLAILIPSV